MWYTFQSAALTETVRCHRTDYCLETCHELKYSYITKVENLSVSTYFSLQEYTIHSYKILNKSSEKINNLWLCKWNDVLVLDCDTDGNVAHTSSSYKALQPVQNSGLHNRFLPAVSILCYLLPIAYIHTPYIFQNVIFPKCFRSSNWPFRHGFPSLNLLNIIILGHAFNMA